MIKIGAIGYGDIAQRRHFPEIAKLSEKAKLVAIAGRREAKLRSCCRLFNISRWYTDVDGMLSKEDLDAVLILTPPDTHVTFAAKAVSAGKHVLVEKPLTMSIDDAKQLLVAVEEQEKKMPITFFPLPHVETPEHRLVVDLLNRSVLGRITNIECHRGHCGPTHANWFYNKAQAGGGVLMDLGVYQISTIVHLFGAARNVTAMYDTYFKSRKMDNGTIVKPDVEDIAMINLKLESGALATINANWNGCLSHKDTRKNVVVIGTEGILNFGIPDGAVYIFRPDGNYDSVPEFSDCVTFGGYPCRRATPQSSLTTSCIVEDFVNAIENRLTGVKYLKQQVHVMEIIMAAYRYGSLKQAVPLKTQL